VKEKDLPADCKLRGVKSLNNVVEQSRRTVQRRWRATQCFRSSHTAERAPEGVEPRHVMRKGQAKTLDGRDAVGRAKFVENIFDIVAQ
jgi:transposase-like protein